MIILIFANFNYLQRQQVPSKNNEIISTKAIPKQNLLQKSVRFIGFGDIPHPFLLVIPKNKWKDRGNITIS